MKQNATKTAKTAKESPAIVMPRPSYVIIGTTAAKVAADNAARTATEAKRAAERAEKAARKAEQTAAATPTDKNQKAATDKRAEAGLLATNAEYLQSVADRKTENPACGLVGYTMRADSPAAVHTAAPLIFERAAARGYIHKIGAFRVFLNLDFTRESEAYTRAADEYKTAKIAYSYAQEQADADPENETLRTEREKTAAALRPARAAVYRAEKIRENAEARIWDAAETVARRTAKNATAREGTPKQWKIRAAAEAGDRTDPDFADMIAAAAHALAYAATAQPVTAEELEEKAAATLAAASSPIPYIRLGVSPVAVRAARRDQLIAAAIRERVAAPALPFWIASAYRAAFVAVNDWLTDCRAIRTTESPAPLSLDELDPDGEIIADRTENDPEAEARAAVVRSAFREALPLLTPTRRAVLKLAARGYSIKGIAKKAGRSYGVIFNHMNAIRATVAAKLKKSAPDIAADLLTVGEMEEARAAAMEAAEKRATATRLASVALSTGKATDRAAVERADSAAAAIREAVAALSDKRRAIWERLARGESVREIARKFGKNEATIREQVQAIRGKLAAAVALIAPDLSAALLKADPKRIAALTVEPTADEPTDSPAPDKNAPTKNA